MPELIDIARRIAAEAVGDEQIEAYVSRTRETHVRAFEGDIESLSSADSAGVGVRVVMGNRQGFAYVGTIDEAAGREALAEARDNAGFASEDEHAGLAAPDGVTPAVLEVWRDELGAFPAASKTEMALELERLARQADDRVRQVVAADYDDSAHEFAIASSTGVEGQSRRTRCFLSGDVIADDGSGSQTGGSYVVGRKPEDLDVDFVATDAVARAVRLLGAEKPASNTVTVLLDPRVGASFLSILAGTLSGEEVAKGRSLFTNRLGETVATRAFDLVEDPTDGDAFGAAEMDSEGLACRPVVLISDGVLKGFLYDTRAARMGGAASTASAVRAGFKSTPGVGARAFALRRGDLDAEGLLRHVGTGLYVQNISGVHSGVNPVSGDFSVGAKGLMIRDGALAEPVREITIASTIQRMLQDVVAIGSERRAVPSNAYGVSLAIAEMAMGGS